MITHDFKIIFVHIPKCAGRSICDIFNQRFDHYIANYYATEMKRFWDNYHKFTIIRNPFDRMVSLYVYIMNHRRHRHEHVAIAPGSMPSFKHWLRTNINHYQGDYDLRSAEGMRGTDGDQGSSFWFSSQRRRLINNHDEIIVPKIFRLEEGTEKIQKYLAGITGINAIIPHSNKSEYDDYRSYYDDDLIELASNFPPIKEDCEAFDYKF